jgi:hypothetical protein
MRNMGKKAKDDSWLSGLSEWINTGATNQNGVAWEGLAGKEELLVSSGYYNEIL